jgi:transposase
MSRDDCHLVIDRDVLAAVNIAKKGDNVFHRSKHPFTTPKDSTVPNFSFFC